MGAAAELGSGGISKSGPVAARDSARIFISGHSLTQQPMPDCLCAIAHSLNTTVEWNRQYIEGSSIRQRTRGLEPNAAGWPGYSEGLNREGAGMNVLDELRRPRTITAPRYDTLVITEINDLLTTLLANDTVRHLRHFHDRIIAANPAGTTYFYAPWMHLIDKNDPRRWIAYERAASPLWQGVVTRINLSLAAEGRADRIGFLPASAALAQLVERATQGVGLAGVSGAGVRATVDSIVADQVHLTPLGSYYMALVTYAHVFGRSPVGAWAPEGMGITQAVSLQKLAWDCALDHHSHNRPWDLERCRAELLGSFIGLYGRYVRDLNRQQLPVWRAYVRWVRHTMQWRGRFAQANLANPFHHDAAQEAGYWLPPP